MKSGRIKKYLKIGVKLKLFEKLKFEKWSSNIVWKLKFWKLNLRIGI